MKTHHKWYCSHCQTAGAYEHGDSEAENTEAIRKAHAAMNPGCSADVGAITVHVPGLKVSG